MQSRDRRAATRQRAAAEVEGLVMGAVEDAVDADLKQIAERDKALADSALAALARAMAREVDNAGNSATSKSMCAGRLQDALDQLRELAPDEEEADKLDDLSARRAARRGSAA